MALLALVVFILWLDQDGYYGGGSGANIQIANVPPNGSDFFGVLGAYVDQNGQLWQNTYVHIG